MSLLPKFNKLKLNKDFKNSFSSKSFSLLFSIFSLFALNAQFYVKGTLTISSSLLSVTSLEPSFIVESTASVTNNGTIENKSTTTVLSNAAAITGTGSFKFSGSTAQTIDGNDRSIDCNVIIDNTNNLSIVTSLLVAFPSTSNDLLLGGLLTFTNGDLITNENRVVFKAGSNYAGQGDTKHIVGWCKKIGNTAFIFPVGTGAKLRTTGISAPAAITDAFECKYFYTSPHSLYNVTLKDATLNNVSQCEYWMLNRTNGSAAATVTLSWDNVFSCGVTSTADLRVARWNSVLSKWVDHGSASVTGSSSAGTLNSSAAISSFSPFTLASAGTANPLPVELIAFDAICEDGNVSMHWSTASEHNNAYFTIERSLDAVTWENITSSAGAGNSTQLLQYNWMDAEPIRAPRYYQLKQTDFDGAFTYSEMVYVKDCSIADNSLTILPNPASEYVQLSLSNGKITHFQVMDSRGQLVAEQSFKEQTSFYDLAISSFQPGVYLVHVSTETGSFVEKFVKMF
ncbi:MAG: hypothetical protein RL679_1929 [Bacteroidota bacterium]